MSKLIEVKKGLNFITRNIIPNVGTSGIVHYFLTLFQNGLLSESPLTIPSFIQIELTSRCNLVCPHCFKSTNNIKNNDLSFEHYQKIIDQNPFLSALLLQGAGEPLLHPQFFDFVQYASKKNIYTATGSNGMLLKKYHNELIKSSLNYLAVSIDAIDELSNKFRPNSNWNLIEQGVEDIKSNEKLTLAIWITLQKDNIDHVENIAKWGAQKGAKHFHVQILQWKDCHELKDKVPDYAEASAAIARIKLVLKNYPYIVVTHDPLIINNKRKNCMWPWQRCFIDSNGSVRPCCVALKQDDIMGNINEDKFVTIWRNNKYKNFRNDLKNGRLPDSCKNCYFL